MTEARIERDRQLTYAAMAVSSIGTLVCAGSLVLSASSDAAVFKVTAAASFWVAILGLFVIRGGRWFAAVWLVVSIVLVLYRLIFG